MASIRPFERADLPAVASLYELVARSGSRMAAPGLERYFEDTFFDHPWADPEIPSLVFVDDDGGVGGFIGSSVRRLEFRGAPIRLGVAGQLVTEPKARNRAAGMFLMKEYLAGAQDLTVTDTASDVVERLGARQQLEAEHLGVEPDASRQIGDRAGHAFMNESDECARRRLRLVRKRGVHHRLPRVLFR